jgi:predicted PurR-regulated permease PerM
VVNDQERTFAMIIGGPTGKKLSLAVLLALAAVTLYLSFVIARPFLTPILTATLLAVAIYPLFARLARQIRNRSLAALLATILVLLALLFPTVLLVNKLADETTALYGWLNQHLSEEGGWRQALTSIADRPLASVAERTGISQDQLKKAALDRLQNVSAGMLNWAKSLVVNLGQTIVDSVMMIFTMFFLLM